MNIKTLASTSVILDPKTKSASDKPVKSEEGSADRDADGRRNPSEGHHEHKDFLDDEELKKVLAKLKNHEGIKRNNLSVEVKQLDHRYFFIIKDPLGKTVRRLSSSEAWELIKHSDDQNKGHLLDTST